MTRMKTITLCADDFGLSSSINHGILSLVSLKRLSAVSCMVNGPEFKTQAPQLIALKHQVQTGLHFNLTEGCLISDPNSQPFSLLNLLLKSHIGWINSSIIKKELHAQLDTYVQVMGDLPDFIDGHQHVHQFPKIRPIFLEVYQQRLRHKKTYIRSTFPMISLSQYQFKSLILKHSGGSSLKQDLQHLSIPHNSYFSGVYDFSEKSDYRALFKQWLALAPSNTLIMCHPGEGGCDAIAKARAVELKYFKSDDFLSDCQNANVILL